MLDDITNISHVNREAIIEFIKMLKKKANTRVDTVTGEVSFYILTPSQIDSLLIEFEKDINK